MKRLIATPGTQDPVRFESQFSREWQRPGVPNESSRVLHVIHPADVGGAETVVRVLASGQRAHGARVAVAALVSHQGASAAFVAELRDESIETHYLCVPGRSYLNERRAIAAICREMSPTVVHTHGYRADVVDGLALRHTVPVVSTVHGYTGGDAKNRLYEWVQRRSLRRFDAVVAVSTLLSSELQKVVRPDRLHVVPNAVAIPSNPLDRSAARAALGIPSESRIIGWVGRLSREKGADVLLDVFGRPEVPAETQLVLIGDGPELEALRRQAKRLQIDSRVWWLGRMQAASRYFSAFDLLVLSSRTEGTPMVILEAMAAGVPIVASRVGGVPDLLVDGTAFLVDPDAPIALAGAIREMLGNPVMARAATRAARVRLEDRYGVSTWVAAYDKVYRSARAEAVRRSK